MQIDLTLYLVCNQRRTRTIAFSCFSDGEWHVCAAAYQRVLVPLFQGVDKSPLQLQSVPKPELPSLGNEGGGLCTLGAYHSVGPGCGQGLRSPLGIQNHFCAQQVRGSLKHFLEKSFSPKAILSALAAELA